MNYYYFRPRYHTLLQNADCPSRWHSFSEFFKFLQKKFSDSTVGLNGNAKRIPKNPTGDTEMSANRKLAFMFEDGNPFAAATTQIDVATLRDHFAAGLNGVNGAAITALLDALIKGELEPLTQDDNMKALWVAAGFKPEHLKPGTLAICATGRNFGFAKSKLPISQGKVVAETAMLIKQMVWDFLKTDTRHLNEREIAAAKVAMVAATVAKEPAKPAKPAKAAKSARKPAKAVAVEVVAQAA